ncbi:MAG: MCE family protein [Pseudomonadales bacterium]|nr:MCE family protein [Pseudomonadales bacterium]
MSKQASPTLIGAFVVGALALLTAAILLFGGTEIFAQKTRFVAYFPESVKGLRTSANVLFRGVRIGFVEEIQLVGDVNTLESQVQVTMRIFPDQFQLTRNGIPITASTREYYSARELIDAGMYAQLGVESYVTGQLLVEVDIQPGVKGELSGHGSPFPEIPTVPNDIQQIVNDVRSFLAELQTKIDVDRLARDVQSAVSGVSELANSVDLREALAGINRIINAEDTQGLPGRLQQTLASADSTLSDTREFVNHARGRVDMLSADLEPVISRLNTTLESAEAALRNAALQLEGDTELSYKLNGTLTEIETTVRTLRIFFDYLERNPEALLRGKEGGKE